METIIPSLCAGISQAIIGHPFDTAKVLIQNKLKLKGLSIKCFYKGFTFPLIMSLAFNGTVFPSFTYINNIIDNSFITGGIVGCIVTPAVFTCENIKVLQQTNKKITKAKLLSRNGIITTLLRESLAMSIYFSSYHYFKNNDYNSFTAGSISGFSNWILTYPIDVIRNRQISQNISFIKAVNQGYLYKGLSITLLRAILVNGSIFYTYEQTNNLINK